MGQTREVIPTQPRPVGKLQKGPLCGDCKGCHSRVCGSADISPTGVWVTSGGPAVAVAMGGEGGGSCEGVTRAGETRDPNF